jgi:hypothetical protein
MWSPPIRIWIENQPRWNTSTTLQQISAFCVLATSIPIDSKLMVIPVITCSNLQGRDLTRTITLSSDGSCGSAAFLTSHFQINITHRQCPDQPNDPTTLYSFNVSTTSEGSYSLTFSSGTDCDGGQTTRTFSGTVDCHNFEAGFQSILISTDS